jgi:hypothetical protein
MPTHGSIHPLIIDPLIELSLSLVKTAHIQFQSKFFGNMSHADVICDMICLHA